MTDILVVEATESDLPLILRAERLDGYDAVVGRWDEVRHRLALADKKYRYFLAKDGNEVVGFAIVRDWASPDRVSLIKRIAMLKPGQGYGSRFLQSVLDRIFNETDVHRVWLGVFPENVRARRAYLAAGFVPEGIARGSAYFGGSYRDELVMAVLRTEWDAAGS
ncbi:GNAT family N-acetyltransferase [Phyllobacterium myrsinacearum]|uniref:RimJ/RimL family protein N-acetyltransferase n=1 Tax=Phyllobacterium myrsinacearum TaxID=28101 RepID=A0A839ESY7_9HYPH|nr:GNAT family protein [Phyllobacterium myrsinacearum]MBA8880634.1 RimJ/RimL family protein N-acetyltransferase [Phyllobacterium myrsinacearum]